jgi:hypothetical protein
MIFDADPRKVEGGSMPKKNAKLPDPFVSFRLELLTEPDKDDIGDLWL